MRIAAGVLALAAWASAQDAKPADRIGKDKPPAAASKMLVEAKKRKSAALRQTSQLGARPEGGGSYEGVLRKDFAAVKGTLEIYALGARYLVNTGGRFDPPDQLKGPEALQAMSFRNPSLILAELGTIVPSATYGGDEAVDGKDCRVIDFVASPALIRQYLRELGERVEKAFEGAGGVFRLANALDEKETVATFRVCVGKDDLLPYKLDFVMRPKVKPGSLPPQVRLPDLEEKTQIHFSRWDEDPSFEVAPFVKAKWGLK